MAKSATTKGFDYRGSLLGVQASPMVIEVPITNSATVTLGDAVRVNTSGTATVCGATSLVGGVVVGIVDKNGNTIFSPRSNRGSATVTGDDTATVASDNATVDMIKVAMQIVLPGNAVYYNDASDTLAQTNLFQHFDLTSGGDQVDVSSASEAAGVVQLVKIDPDGDGDVSKGLFVFAETQLPGTISDAATAKTAA